MLRSKVGKEIYAMYHFAKKIVIHNKVIANVPMNVDVSWVSTEKIVKRAFPCRAVKMEVADFHSSVTVTRDMKEFSAKNVSIKFCSLPAYLEAFFLVS